MKAKGRRWKKGRMGLGNEGQSYERRHDSRAWIWEEGRGGLLYMRAVEADYDADVEGVG